MKESEPRIIKVDVGGVDFKIERTADDPRPDNEITIGGIVLDLDTGDIKVDESEKGGE